MRISTIIFLFLVGYVCSNSLPALKGNDEQSRAMVSGGVLAAAGEFPYTVFLMLTSGTIVGGGTLVGPSHVLTSAQGLLISTPSFMSMLRVTFNSTSTFGGVGAFLLPVSKIVIHELFNSTTYDNNLALVVLSSPVTNLTFVTLPTSPTTIPPPTTTTSTTKVPTTKTSLPTTKLSQTTTKTPSTTTKTSTTAKTPIPTTKTTAKITTGPTTTKTTAKTAKTPAKPVVSQKPLAAVLSSSNRAFNSYANMSAVISGWGRRSPGGVLSPLFLKKVNATILDNQSCTSSYNSTFIGNDMLCSSAPVACLDDTGSPIIVDGVQVGLTMWGTLCTGPAAGVYSGIYTRVTTYVDWIAATMANNPGPALG